MRREATLDERLRHFDHLAAMLASVLAGTLSGAAPKLASQLYLLSLPVLVLALVDDRDELRRLFRVWLAGTAVCAGIGAGTVVLFAAGVDRASIDYALHSPFPFAVSPRQQHIALTNGRTRLRRLERGV